MVQSLHTPSVLHLHVSQEPLLERELVVTTKEVIVLIHKESPQQPNSDVQIQELAAILLSLN